MSLPTLLLALSTAFAPLVASAVPSSSKGAWHVDAARHVNTKRADIVPETFQVVGNSGVSAQMMFNPGVGDKVYIIDKTENNPLTTTSDAGITHPAWAVSYDINTNEVRAMDVESNPFCAGGGSLGNGSWAVFGGNQPITTGGVAVDGNGAYTDTDGGAAIRMLDPCGDDSCEYAQGTQSTDRADTGANIGGYLQMTSNRWYPAVETLEDGSLMVIGGDNNGGYVNTIKQDNPTYEFFPPKGDGQAVKLQWLSDNLPVNLYPLTWMLPSGKLFMQANRSTILYDYNTQETTDLPGMPYAVRVYPASAAATMLPLTPANNYTATLIFCGGSNPPQWGSDGGAGFNVTAVVADDSCVRITPDDANPTYEDDDFLPTGRSMGQFVYLPDGTIWMGNGIHMGTAGYGDENYAFGGMSYGIEPILQPGLYDPSQDKGARWNWNLSESTQERMYHSTAVLLKDGSILISGSNPNADVNMTTEFPTSYSVERWYPKWYNEERPGNLGLPQTLSYGGSYWNVTLNTTDEAVVQTAQVNVIRGGFSTHTILWGQRFLQLETSYVIDQATNTTTLMVSQMPPNPSIFAPGPAMIFLSLDGVPSEGLYVMVGNGEIGTQPTAAAQAMPAAAVLAAPSTTSSSTAASGSSTQKASSQQASTGAAMTVSIPLGLTMVAGLIAALVSFN